MFRQAKRRTAGRKNFESRSVYASAQVDSLYSNRLSFYDIPPLLEITLEEFELWAIDRLKILIEIESCAARNKSVRDIEATIKPLLSKYMPLSPAIKDQNEALVHQERLKDHYSHYILRLVFCRTEELRKKFIKNEVILFKIRYSLMQPKEQHAFVESYNDMLNWNYISPEEKNELFDQLYAATSASVKTQLLVESDGASITNDQLKNHIRTKENFIKLPFENVPNLLASRSVFLAQGYAYIPTSLQLNLLAQNFQDNLEKHLLKTFQSIPRLEEDDRLLPLLTNLSRNFSDVQYEAQFGENSSDINSRSILTPRITKHYPLCATVMQKRLVKEGHMKYAGRQQFGLFLKGIGLSLDEALKFWSEQFTKGGAMTLEKFNKEYKYNIRHNYGKEGARINYKPHDCATILRSKRPGKDEAHGCPYRDLNPDALLSNLRDMGITDQADINGIMDDVNKNNYTVACTRVFELTHQDIGGKNTNLHINHPNLYFDRSRQLEKNATKA